MNTIHVANGDYAVQSFTEALKLAERDDLVVGPLRDIDDSSFNRAAFWRQVLNSAKDFEKTISRSNRRCSVASRAAKRRSSSGTARAPAIS